MKSRKEMNPEFTWDFTHIYADNKAWESALAEADKIADTIPALKGTLGESAESLKKAMDLLAKANQAAELPYIYAMLYKSADNGDNEAQEMEAKAVSLLVKLGTVCSFIEPEILSIPEDTLKQYMEYEGLATYRHMLEDISRGRAHVLDEKSELLLAQMGDITRIPDDCFTMFSNVDMELPCITDEKGEKVQLTNGNMGIYRESKDRRVREETFEGYFGTYKKYVNTVAAMYAGNVKIDNYFAAVRGYESACHKALFGGNIPVSVYDSLIEAVHGALPTMKRYINLRKETLGLENIDMFDLYTPMMEDVDYTVTFEQAKDMVKKALLPLGERYQELLDKAYSEHWMDVYENKGKRSGAFSCGVYGVHPYVLLNYTDSLDDAFTMAHELGHAMHSYLSSEKQDYVNHDYRIMVAEVASTVNEVLLTMYLLENETDKKRKAYILNHFLEGFRTTVFRQTLFAEFERKAHDMAQAGVPLTPKALCDIYHSLISLYYEGAGINDIMQYEWAYIPHFYTAYYVYQYATGFSSAVAIARNILETGDASGYLEFLTTGGSDYPLNELKIAGIDLTKPEAVSSAMKVFDDTVTELKELLSEI